MNHFQKHQLKIAKRTLTLSDTGARILGGMTKREARDFLRSVRWTEQRIRKHENQLSLDV